MEGERGAGRGLGCAGRGLIGQDVAHGEVLVVFLGAVTVGIHLQLLGRDVGGGIGHVLAA